MLVKNPPANAGGPILIRKIPMEEEMASPLQYSARHPRLDRQAGGTLIMGVAKSDRAERYLSAPPDLDTSPPGLPQGLGQRRGHEKGVSGRTLPGRGFAGGVVPASLLPCRLGLPGEGAASGAWLKCPLAGDSVLRPVTHTVSVSGPPEA